uniref:NADH dehydrogenase subunit 6 n=1 Tax=Lispe assimilis TaxID=1670692 RepID=UPI001D01486C|nr:NADH dehydrogenase subunit 6 [Lispe assimilis]QVG62683.1 NADH dehydrogenase subunit 6 [Lispe assimilis]
MIQWILLFFLLFSFSMFLIFMNNPLSMGLTMLIQTLLISLIISFTNTSSWFSYILFLTFLGGLLILFIYTASFSSNETFNFNFKEISMFMMMNLFFLIISMYLMTKYPNLLSNLMNLEMNQISKQTIFLMENSKLMIQLYKYQSLMLTMMMILFLLISMTIINKISNPFFGTFRIKFN